MKKLLFFLAGILCLCGVIFWCGRIYSVNSAYSDDTERYGAGDTVSISGLEMKAVETRIYSIDEYKERFNADPVDMLDPQDRMICVRMQVTNTGDEAVGWDKVSSITVGGFESVTWCSSADPYSAQPINVFRSENLPAGAEQDVWCVTSLARVSFGQKTWDNIKDEEFWYVPALEPVKIMMKLELHD